MNPPKKHRNGKKKIHLKQKPKQILTKFNKTFNKSDLFQDLQVRLSVSVATPMCGDFFCCCFMLKYATGTHIKAGKTMRAI